MKLLIRDLACIPLALILFVLALAVGLWAWVEGD